MNDLIFVPGEWFCKTCNCRLHKRFIDARSGAVGVDPLLDQVQPAEKCPNECGNMSRVTWKQEALELRELVEKMWTAAVPA